MGQQLPMLVEKAQVIEGLDRRFGEIGFMEMSKLWELIKVWTRTLTVSRSSSGGEQGAALSFISEVWCHYMRFA
eukprot:2530482-Amphidinium_carterae.1